jgi:hypothetical protein
MHCPTSIWQVELAPVCCIHTLQHSWHGNHGILCRSHGNSTECSQLALAHVLLLSGCKGVQLCRASGNSLNPACPMLCCCSLNDPVQGPRSTAGPSMFWQSICFAQGCHFERDPLVRTSTLLHVLNRPQAGGVPPAAQGWWHIMVTYSDELQPSVTHFCSHLPRMALPVGLRCVTRVGTFQWWSHRGALGKGRTVLVAGRS